MITHSLHKFYTALLVACMSSAVALGDEAFNPSLPPEPNLRTHVTVSADDANGATVSGEGWYSAGQKVKISCSLKKNYQFRYWTLNGDSCSNKTSFTYTVTQSNAHFVAYTRYVKPDDPTPPVDPPFVPNLPDDPGKQPVVYTSKVYFTAEPNSAGTFSQKSGQTYQEGASVSVCTYANENYEFVGWYNNEQLISEQECINLTVPVQDLRLIAKYQPIEEPVYYSHIYLTSNKTGACTFNISSSNTYEAGTRVIVARTPSNKYEWLGWYINNELISTDSAFVYRVGKQDVNIKAMFEDFFVPTLPDDPGEGGGEIDNRPTVMIEAPYKPGWIFDHWNDGDKTNPRSVLKELADQYIPIYVPITYVTKVRMDICDGEVLYIGGQPITEEGFYRDTLVSMYGADSVIEYSVFVHYPFEQIQRTNIYKGDSILFQNHWYKTEGVHQVTYANQYGCDSVYTLNLSVIDTVRQYTLSVKAADITRGTVTGGGLYAPNTFVQITASGINGNIFSKWNDGNTDNPRNVVVTQDTSFTAFFEGDPLLLDTVLVSDKRKVSELMIGSITHIIVKATGCLVVDEPTAAASLTLCQTNTASAQVVNIADLSVAETDMVLRLEPTANQATLAKWYAFGVPFEVEINAGIRPEGASYNALMGYDFVIDQYDGASRANIKQGWKRCQTTDILHPGQFYMIAINGTQNEWRFTKKSNAEMQNQTNIAVYQYASAVAKHSGWNGVSNAMMQKATAQMAGLRFATVYHNATSTYETVLLAQSALDASHPFFVQVAKSGTILLSEATSNAPMRAINNADDSPIYTIAFENNDYTDRAYLSLSETKANEYTIGLDVEKMQANTTSQPQLWLEVYGMQLAAHEASIEEKTITVIPIGLYAPQDGEYSITTTTTFALLNNGSKLTPTTTNKESNTATWTLYLTKGTNIDYSLMIGEQGIETSLPPYPLPTTHYTKFIHNGTLYITQDGKVYNTQGVKINENRNNWSR